MFVVGGPVFQFLVGKHQKAMTIHTILTAEQSSALRTLVSGSMKEAQAGTVNWEDVDEETLARWAQFVYTETILRHLVRLLQSLPLPPKKRHRHPSYSQKGYWTRL